jgi:ketosteroid isomerase-like protein
MRAKIEAWLRAFAASVRARDYAAGAALFARDVVGFGSAAARVEGLDALVEHQWRVVWETTRDFDFDYASISCGASDDLAWAAATWSSADAAATGACRAGRATLVFARDGSVWRAVHSHFSLVPESA